MLAASVNVLLTLSYIAVMGVYAMALAAYTVPYLPEASRALATQLIASFAIIVLGLVNFMGASLMTRLEAIFNIGKLGVLSVFIVAGLVVGQFQWSRFSPAEWAPTSTIVASGMLGFLAYEGFELIANASGSIRDRNRVLPIAFLGCVAVAIAIYVLAFIVGIGHLSFASVEAAQTFAISEAAGSFLGPAGFAMMSVGAILASASAINADYFGASKLPVTLSRESELPSAFQRSIHGKSVVSLVTIGVLALFAINVLDLQSLSAATSGGFLIVFAAVNIAAIRLAPETGTRRLVPLLAAILCIVALCVMVAEFLADPATVISGAAVGFMVALAVMIESTYRAAALRAKKDDAPSPGH